MRTLFQILGLPAFVIGVALGFILRPFANGFAGAFYYYDLKEQDRREKVMEDYMQEKEAEFK